MRHASIFAGQQTYYAKILRMIQELDLQDAVRIDPRYLSVQEQAETIQNAHLGVFAYQDPSQSSSGTVPLVLSLGIAGIWPEFDDRVSIGYRIRLRFTR